jgi:hypothetical protein
MALFRHKKRHEADQPAEEAVEVHETLPSPLDPGALTLVRPADREIATEELRTEANPEDDGARTQMIEDERRREEHGS